MGEIFHQSPVLTLQRSELFGDSEKVQSAYPKHTDPRMPPIYMDSKPGRPESYATPFPEGYL